MKDKSCEYSDTHSAMAHRGEVHLRPPSRGRIPEQVFRKLAGNYNDTQADYRRRQRLRGKYTVP